jgi:peptidyl-prolyl cis-trans isomerase SurA
VDSLFGVAPGVPFIYGVQIMKKTFLSFAVIFSVAAVFAQSNAAPQNMSIEIDGYAARVNDRVITRGEVREILAPILPELYRAYQGDQLEKELEKAFVRARDELVDRALIMEAFALRGGQIPDQYVNEEIKRVIKERFKGDEALFEQVLTEQKQTRENYMNTIREQMAVGMMTNEEVSRRARITPEQVRKEYEENKALYFIPEKVKHSVIVLNKGVTIEDQSVKLQEAVSILQRLAEGADFTEVAKEVSEGSRAAEGGSFPWMQPKDVRPELQEPLKSLPAGKIGALIETESELYIVKVEARQQSGHKSFEEVRHDIKNTLTAKERDRLKNRWITRLKETNYVVIYE